LKYPSGYLDSKMIPVSPTEIEKIHPSVASIVYMFKAYLA
jgi:hypothetical protein